MAVIILIINKPHMKFKNKSLLQTNLIKLKSLCKDFFNPRWIF